MHKYRLVSKKGEGTFSEVLKAQSVETTEYFAVKCMKNHFKSIEQVNSLREIQALRRLSQHDGIIQLEEVLFDEESGRLALVFELMDMNIYELIRGRREYVNKTLIKNLMWQLIKAVAHMHRNGIFHRDVKPENILVRGKNNMEMSLKVADFGSCRGIYTKQPFTEYISTRWYRAPECLLTSGIYDSKMDMWGIGCVMFEIVSLFPLFPGTNELDQIAKVHAILGTPDVSVLEKFSKQNSQNSPHNQPLSFAEVKATGIRRLIPHADDDCIDLIEKLLAYDPNLRMSAKDALKHSYFKGVQRSGQRVHTASPKLGGEAGEGNTNTEKPDKKKTKEKKQPTNEDEPNKAGIEIAIDTSQGTTQAPAKALQPAAKKKVKNAKPGKKDKLPNIEKKEKKKKKKNKMMKTQTLKDLEDPPDVGNLSVDSDDMASLKFSDTQSNLPQINSNSLSLGGLNVSGYNKNKSKNKNKKNKEDDKSKSKNKEEKKGKEEDGGKKKRVSNQIASKFPSTGRRR